MKRSKVAKELQAEWNAKVAARLVEVSDAHTNVGRLPECPGIYILYDLSNVIAYIGKSCTSLRRRVGEHDLFMFSRFKWLALPAHEATQLERLLINTLKPYGNRARGKCIRGVDTVEYHFPG